MAEHIKMNANMNWSRRHWPSCSKPGVCQPWADAESILLGIMATHGAFSMIVQPFCQRYPLKDSRDKLIMTVSFTVALWVAVAATSVCGSSSTQFLPWSIVVSHAIKVYHEVKVAKPTRSVINGSLSALFLLVLQIVRFNQERQFADLTYSSVLSLSLSFLPLVVLLSVPRGNDELFQGSPVDRQSTASVIELLTLLWPRSVFRLEKLKKMEIGALPVLPIGLRMATLTERHRRIASQLPAHRLDFLLLRMYLIPLLFQSTLAILTSISALGPNLVRYRLLQYLSGEHEADNHTSLFLALLFGVSHLIPVLFTAWMEWIGSSMIDIPMRYSLTALTYQKILSLPTIPISPDEKEAKSMATLLYMNALSARACSAFPLCYRFIGLITQLISTTAVLVALVGWKSVAIAIATALLIAPLSTLLMKRWYSVLLRTWKLMANRSAVLQDALLAIRQIKLSADEPSWKQKIYKLREKEVQGYHDIAWIRFWMELVETFSPIVLSGIPIYIYAWQGHALTASVAFTFISLFKELQSKLWGIPQTIPQIRAAWASAGELDSYLRREEINESQFVASDMDTLSLRNAAITWHTEAGKEEAFQLKNLTAEFPAGELSIITGKTGCGKSLFLSALAGEAKILSGDIYRPYPSHNEHQKSDDEVSKAWVQPGSFALVSQSPWMDNATIQDNILFGLPMDKERYAHVIYCCALEKDLLKFEKGDLTVMTIKGVSLSGGQRSRIALARALYSEASFLLMDDVLSAVDAEIRDWIVEKALCGSLMHGRTRILVTHHEEQVRSKISCQLLIHDQTATVVYKDTASSTEKGLTKSCLAHDGFDYSVHCEQMSRSPDKEATTPTGPGQTDTAGAFRLTPYIMYFNASGGTKKWLIAFIFLGLCEGTKISASSYLAKWVSEDESSGSARSYSLSPGHGYMLMSALTTLTMSMRGYLMFRLYRTASKKLFYQMTEHIFGAPLLWLETTSHGEILHRSDRDTRIVDEDLTYAIGPLFALGTQLITVLWSSASFSLYNTPLIVALLHLFFAVGKNLIPATKYLTAIESIAISAFAQHRSSLYAPEGVSTVRAYRMKNYFFGRANQMLDRQASATWHSSLHSVMTNLQLGFLSAIYITLSCYSAVIAGAGAGTVGVALSFAVQLSEIVPGCLQRISSLESGLKAAERVNEYGSIEQEPVGGRDVEDSWPAKGELQVSKYAAGYGPGLPDTLNKVTFTVRPGERVGVVGRTGAGKSTLALSFARLIEKRDGFIHIDAVDISRIKLEVLRKRILIIPQDPYLFGGTIRATIDPGSIYSEEELVAALQQYGFSSTVDKAGKQNQNSIESSGLSFMVSDGGANLSQGQRQILCLVKAMLSRKKVVIMDEATSAVDIETDSTIQAVIREGLQDATIMVIAHRLATVAHLDKVLVLQDGKVVEFGPPAELYQQEGQFWTLVNHSVDKDEVIKSFKGN